MKSGPSDEGLLSLHTNGFLGGVDNLASTSQTSVDGLPCGGPPRMVHCGAPTNDVILPNEGLGTTA